ncbi:hypothetical protein C8_181 [Cannes 8 virus]|uniref:Uncharacterized protein n=1 Tax=Marseillevirus marseillevirus TaxID=694581 RepID=D2XAH8_GBMV|nr:hypothetical protein MAR_ORF174 [Marseillevirus marseillevirus]ADB03955.1 hypothetical protein MAR_ORF174 [Marseillevirus marseillevirus]AGV01530.1 hypothetical protein C8_181 [Cannes 8 virus]ANB78255.1 hypothetical protein MEL_154b [Melbournevirus]
MSWRELGEIFPEFHGWWTKEEGITKTIVVMVSQKYEGIPDFYFSQKLGELVALEQEITGPIIPY